MQEAEKITNFTAAVSNLNSALKKVPTHVQSCAWARSVIFLQRNIVRWAQRHDLAYFRDATDVVHMLLSSLRMMQYCINHVELCNDFPFWVISLS